jgi:hypothetical protein
MTSILKAVPYPWSNPLAQELHIKLTQFYPTNKEAEGIAQKAQINTSLIFGQQAVFFMWKEILDLAATSGLTAELVKTAHDSLPLTSLGRPFFKSLLDNAPILTEGGPRGPDNAPQFLSADDEISEQEALLYKDDLMISIGRVPALIKTLERLVTLAPAVCKLEVGINNLNKQGTGFRIGPDMLLTNWHVLHRTADGTRATVVTAEFGYEEDGQGAALGATVVPCAVSSILGDKGDDWAVIRVAQPLKDEWPVIKLSEAVAPVLESAAYIIQHPSGARKRLGFVRNQISHVTDQVVHYLTDTKDGSSGAPVFNADGRLIALHHSGGRPQDVAGLPPTKKNEGIRITRVLAGLTQHNVVAP